MAESAAVSFVVAHLTTLLQEEATLLGGVREEVEHIKYELELMRVFLSGAEAREEPDPMLKICVQQLRNVAYDTEDILDEFMLRFVHNHGHRCCGFPHEIVFSIKNLIARHQLTSDIRIVESRVNSIFQSYERDRNLGQGSSYVTIGHAWHDGRGDALLLQESDLVGIEKPKQQLIGWLLDGDSQRQVVSVWGMGGSGKTTLVKKVFEDNRIKTEFQSHAWITVSQAFNIVELLKDTIQHLYAEINQAPPQGVETMNEYDLKAVVREFLQKRRYIIVLDDVWTIGAWYAIKLAFPNVNRGSRVLLTTRVRDVASTCSESHYMYEMKALSPAESWTLFCNKTFQGKCCPPYLEKVSRIILGKCAGLPLAIVVISGVLALKDNKIDEWEMVQHSLGALLEHNERIERVLSLSYYDLPYYLQICFLYLCIFPEDYEIEKGIVTRLWSAEGLVQEREGKTTEDVAESYFNELVNRSLIQITIPKDMRGCIRWRIHNLLVEMIVSISREQNIITIASGDNVRWAEKVRRLAIHNSIGNVKEQKCFERIRSMLYLGVPFSEYKFPVSLILSGGSKLLKVLDLQYASLDKIPNEVFGLIHLRYLRIWGRSLEAVPKSIGKLQNLETLELKDTYDVELPAEIGMLRKLRYLRMGSFEAPPEIGNLLSLQNLRAVKPTDINGMFILTQVLKLTQLRKLGIRDVKKEHGMALRSAIERLNNLRSLIIWAADDDIIDLHSVSSGPPFLKKLELGAHLEMVPPWISSLHNLVRLTLRASKLRDDPLQSLQDLPNLSFLNLDNAYDGEELCFKAGGFQRLKLLELGLEQLRWMRIEQGAMPHLVRLYIKDSKVEELPSGIEHLTNLQSLTLYTKHYSLAQTLCKRDREQGDYWKIAHIPEVVIQSINEDGHLEEYNL